MFVSLENVAGIFIKQNSEFAEKKKFNRWEKSKIDSSVALIILSLLSSIAS